MTDGQRQFFQITALILSLIALLLLVFSRASEVGEGSARTDTDVDLVFPPQVKNTVARRVYEDLPNIDITSWEYILCNPAHNIGQYVPEVVKVESGNSYFDTRAVDALIAMLNGAREAGFYPRVYVGYRSYVNQASQYQSQVNKFVNEGYSQLDAEKAAAEISAAPGTSEHQTGLGADLVDRYTESLSGFTLDPNFEAWLNEHCVEYGFIMRYPENKISVTGRYEPWHVRYVGQIAANFMKMHDLCLEEFVMLY